MYVCRKAIELDFSVAIYSVPNLLAQIRDTFESDSARSKMQLFNALTSVDFLHLDDLGAEMQTEWVIEQLYAIVNERYENELPISVTTNLDRYQLIDQVEARTVSRLTQICGEPLALFGKDKRIDPFDSMGDEPTVKRTIAD
jgi:DNA replication protein DnaC